MTDFGSTWLRDDLGGGVFRHTQFLDQRHYLSAGAYRESVLDFESSGNDERPHIVTRAPLMFSVAPDGMRRFHPTRELDRYAEIGAPYIKNGSGQWFQPSLGSATRTGSRITWDNTQVRLIIDHGGHFAKLAIFLKKPNGVQWFPNNMQFAFPVGLSGLTRDGGTLLADGVPVMRMRAPHVEDLDNPFDMRPIEHDFVQINSQWYVVFTLPASLVSNPMSRVLVDPTFEVQPDAAAGLDTWIYANTLTINNNYGINTTLRAGTDASGFKVRGLLKLVLTGLPAGASVSSGILALFCEGETAATDRDVAVHRALTQWFEGAKNAAAPDVGQDGSTWNHRNANGSVAWGAAGGQSGVDYAATATATTTITGASASFTWDITPDVVAWQTTNHGLWLIGNEAVTDHKIFTPSDGAVIANRPKLTIVYTLPGALLLAQHRYAGGWH